ncbi:hypothetical protein C6P46_005922 [Rhodotorula mucilaginosa]|uniref:Vps72/YL1 C-terminal domain-containing protein n=1 Tax=Rhodotorula mucilaginosa TaxID=5537 RepID=A0A9P6W8T2_RHOMI|nr:hypothetical protein C6P46_005922 [Rhodotorula mucilaginosa]
MARRARKASPSPAAEPEETIENAEEEAASACDDEEQDGSDDSGDNDEESSDEEQVYVEPNLATRTRRANAGARMAALIEDEAAAGIEADEMFKEEENDEEFAQKEEKDEFDSDFGSTDEGEGDEEDDEEAGERKLQREAKEAKKAARGKKKGFQAPVHPFARQTKAARKAAAAATQPVASTSASTLDGEGEEPPKKRKRVAVDPAFLAPQRESTRRTAVEIRKQVQDRAKESEQRKATVPKQQRKATVKLTQADLIAEALETEETNRAALLAFYAAEEDRREAERIAGMRYEIIGPKLTFLSRVQDRVDKGKGKEGEQVEKGRRRMIEVLGETGQKGWKGGVGENQDAAAAGTDNAHPTMNGVSSSSSLAGILNPLDPNLSPSAPPEPKEYARNWLIFDNFEGGRAEELEAIFGDHVDWSKPAPLPVRGTKRDQCPITGLPARYRDPQTLTPYATLAAYHALRAMVDSQAFVWSESLGAYTAAANFGIMRDVEASWARRPQPKDALPRYAAAGPTPPAHRAGTFGNIAAAQPVPRAPRQRQPQTNENPYKIEYAHSGGSGRGQRGRSSIGEGTSDLPPPPPPSAMHPVPVAAPAPPPSAMHPVPVAASMPPLPQAQAEPVQAQAPASSSYGLQPTVAPEPYSTDNVYRVPAGSTPPVTTPPVTTPQPMYSAQQQQLPPPPVSSPSLVGTSSAPQARSIQLGSGRSGAFGGGIGGASLPGQPSSPFSAAPPQMTTAGLPLPGTLPPLPPQL